MWKWAEIDPLPRLHAITVTTEQPLISYLLRGMDRSKRLETIPIGPDWYLAETKRREQNTLN